MYGKQPRTRTGTARLRPGASELPAKEPTFYIAKAEKLAGEGHTEEAITTLDAAIAASPDRPELWRAKARVWSQLGDPKKASDALDAALKRFREDPGLLMDKAVLQAFEGNFAYAGRTFHRLTKIQPNNAEVWLGRGQSLLSDGKAKQALACADKVIELDSGTSTGYALRGDSQLRLGQWEGAFRAFTMAAELDSNQFDSSDWTTRGARFLGYAQQELALHAYERAIAQDPGNPEGWHGKGTVLKARGDLDGALAAFERASTEDKAFIVGFLDAGALCAERGDLKRALDLFKRGQEARPNDPRPWIAIGGVHERRREYEEARAAYEQAAKIDPEDAKTWNSLGSTLYNLGLWDAALQTYRRAIEASRDYDWPHSNLAQVFLKLRRFDKAVQSINRAIEIDPQNPVFWNIKLWVLSVAGRIDEIDATAVRALEAAGDNVDQRVTVASFFADVGDVDRARDLLRDVQPSVLRGEVGRLRLAESLLVVGDYISAVTLLRTIDSAKLTDSLPVVRSFLHLLADRLAGAANLSEELLTCFLREFGKRVDQFEEMGRKWGYLSIDWGANGARRILIQSELPAPDKLVLATLIDLQEAKIQRAELSFFADIWPRLG
jgi:tetratricopeptide (TPR) repeat protein